MSASIKLWSLFPSTVWASAVLAAGLAFACGSVDPADNQPNAGGDGSGNAATGGTDPGEAGAGGSSAGTAGSGEPPLEPLLPWAVGNSWTYEVTKDGVTTIKTTTVGELEEIGGTGPYAEQMAYHVTTAKGVDSMDRTESWQAPDADNPLRIVRFREQSFGAITGKLQLEEHWDPAKLHIDGSTEHTAAEASWLEDYDETKLEVGLQPTTHTVRDRWTVIAADETLEVPAGTFENVIHFQKSGGSSAKQYWYARGVGKLKETGSQTEVLTDYSVAEGEP
jgi:hypothetical protein